MSNNSEGSSGFSWFLAGLGLGSLLGVLYAPRSGQQTRDELVESALGGTEYVRQRSREATRAANTYAARTKGQAALYAARGRQQAAQYADLGRQHVTRVVSTTRDRALDAVEAGRQKINEAYAESLQAVAEQKEKIAASYEAGKQAYNETSVAPLPHEDLIPSSEQLG